MEHLKSVFDTELADVERGLVRVDPDGAIVIYSRRWPPAEVLREISGGGYEEVFKAWLAERRVRMLEKADEILGQFNLEDRFEALRMAYERGLVMPFVGAGMSVPSEYPAWTKFLYRARERTAITEPELTVMLERNEYERAAQEIADRLGSGFNELVESVFGRSRPLRGPVQLLPLVFDTPVVTTNFDDVLERCYQEGGKPFATTVSGLQAEELPRWLSAGRRVLIKMHGTAITGRDRVLTAREYDAAYGGDTLLRIVRALCHRTLLFMGSRLTIDRLLTAFGEHAVTEGDDRTTRHYAFLPAPDDPAVSRAREMELAKLNIFPIWYPAGEDDESIEALLFNLADLQTPR